MLSNIATERPDGKGKVVPCKTWDNATLVCDTKDKKGNGSGVDAVFCNKIGSYDIKTVDFDTLGRHIKENLN